MLDMLSERRRDEMLVLIRQRLITQSDVTPSTNSNALVTNTPVFLVHCEDDEVVISSHGERLYRLLGALTTAEWHFYETGGHWLNAPDRIDAVMAFIRKSSGKGLDMSQ
jgi:predicted esterase